MGAPDKLLYSIFVCFIQMYLSIIPLSYNLRIWFVYSLIFLKNYNYLIINDYYFYACTSFQLYLALINTLFWYMYI